MNPIKQVIHSKIQSLSTLSRAAGAMNHATTVGSVRESYLTSFLKELLPQGVTATSGVLCDCVGNTSRQFDLVLTLDSSLPIVSMRDGIALIPVDSALLAIEIKSTLTTDTLTQMKEQNESITKLYISNEPTEGNFIIPTMVVAMEGSQLSCEKTATWIHQQGNTVACCVIGKYFVRRDGNQIPIRVESSSEGSFNETMAFLECLYRSIIHLKSIRKLDPIWASYLLDRP